MEYGHFDDANREYVITRPDTPLPWYNYIHSGEWGGLVSHTGGGASYHRDPATRRFLRYRYTGVPADRPGRYVYLRDGETGDYWSATWAPVEKPLDEQRYECRVGLNVQTIRTKYSGIATEMTYFVAPDHHVEIWRLKLRNESGRPRSLRTWSYAELACWGTLRDLLNLDNNPRCSRVQWTDHTLIQSTWNDLGASLGTSSWVRVFGYFTSSETPVGYDTDRDMFLGRGRTEANPVVVETGVSNNHCENGGLPLAAVCHAWELAPGEERTVVYQMGVADDPEDFAAVIPIYRDLANVDAALAKVRATWDARLARLQVRTPDPDFDTVANVWSPYQVAMTSLESRTFCSWKWGTSVGMGFRDTSQDVMGVCHLMPDLTRRKLRLLMSIQFADGTPAHGYIPSTDTYTDRDFRDDHLWMVLSTCNYLKETGDLSLLDETIRYMDAGDGSGYDHLDRAIEATMRLRGENGLPQVGHADWNDGLNPQSMSSESVFVAMLFCAACREMVELAQVLGRKEDASRYRRHYETIRRLANDRAWDGAWYRRVLLEGGGWIGGADAELGRIFVEPQAWAVLGGVAEGERATQTLDSVHEHLGTEFGIRLVSPPFPEYDPKIGAISIVLPGTKENGSVFHHTNPWVICAETVLGRGEVAMDLFRRISPATKNRMAELHAVEPYVTCQWTGLPPWKHPGRGANPWLTGTAAWVSLAITQYILGMKPAYDGLRIDPCVPKSWTQFEIDRTFRGAKLHITVENPEGVEKGVKRLSVDGKGVAGNTIPVQPEGTEHAVEVLMG
ncbi:MAG TPA: glycosyl hydrolase family 65 protein [Planctomycetota bacterium]|nr:glycosyl hydrolase family 65 protein [Planctomycetota bacterium]